MADHWSLSFLVLSAAVAVLHLQGCGEGGTEAVTTTFVATTTAQPTVTQPTVTGLAVTVQPIQPVTRCSLGETSNAFAPSILSKSRRDISRKTEDVIEGLIEAFLHEQQLEPCEKMCMRKLVGNVAADVVSAVDDAIMAIKELLRKDRDNMDVIAEVTDAGTQVTSIIRLAKELVRDCVKGDVLQALNTSAKHLMNMTYVGDRLLANGVDIAEALAESVIDWDKGDYRDVGEHIGLALRKILLSRASKSPPLPEGVPRSEIISQVTSGLMNGFFVTGSKLTITDPAAPKVNIHIDLHQCITENLLFFQNVFKGLWTLIAQMASNPEQFSHLLDMFHATKPNQRRLAQQQINDAMSELGFAMVQIPVALHKCDIDKETEDMLADAMKSLQEVKFDFDFPKEKFSEKEIRDLLARAVEAWTRFQFAYFGEDVGELLRAMVLVVFPQEYEVDKAGHLKRSLVAKAAEYHAKKPSGALLKATLVLSCATVALAAFFLAARAFQNGCARRRYDSLSRRDISRLEEHGQRGPDDACRAGLAVSADIELLEAQQVQCSDSID